MLAANIQVELSKIFFSTLYLDAETTEYHIFRIILNSFLLVNKKMIHENQGKIKYYKLRSVCSHYKKSSRINSIEVNILVSIHLTINLGHPCRFKTMCTLRDICHILNILTMF